MSAHSTAAEMVAAWDRGDSIASLEMGGLGPGYEQALQVAAVEFTRDALAAAGAGTDATADNDAWRAHCDASLAKHNATLGGLTGAQFGVAAWLAYQWMTIGPQALQAKARAKEQDDRCILVSKMWPRAAEAVA